MLPAANVRPKLTSVLWLNTKYSTGAASDWNGNEVMLKNELFSNTTVSAPASRRMARPA